MNLNDLNITTVPSLDVDYYQSISYWNHFELVYRRLNRRATGDEDTWFSAFQGWIVLSSAQSGLPA